MATIGNQVSAVASLLGGRTDLNSQISNWLAAGYRDIASTVPLETLEDTEDGICVSGIGEYDYPSSARAIKALSIQVPAGSPKSSRPLYKRNVDIIDRYVGVLPGVPAVWAPFNTEIVMRPVPNDSYPFIVRFWQKPQIAATVNDTVLKVPDDWLEIITYEAQMRGYIDLQEPDKAAGIRTLLYGQGDPRKPGLIKQRLTRIQAESSNANYGMRPRITRYGWVK